MIYLIISCCIYNKVGNKNAELRKKQYIQSITTLLNLVKNDTNIKPIIVENNGVRKTYLDTLGCDVLYTNTNTENYPHKGMNELLDIHSVIRSYNIQDNDMIIKITGRYTLLDKTFIENVKNTSYDAYIKFFNVCTKEFRNDDCVLGLFAMRCKYLKNFKYTFKKSAECDFASYVRETIPNLQEIKSLNLQCCFADDLRTLIV
jgi:hypothetical protein